MKDQETLDFIANSDEELIKDYLKELMNKLQLINSKNDKLSLLLILTTVTYFLIKNSLIANISIGPIELSKFDIGIIVLPPIFALMLLYYAVLNVHRAEVIRTSKVISYALLKQEKKNIDDEFYASAIVRQFLPFSFWEEIMKMNYHQNKVGCISSILSLPLLGIGILPFWFEIYSIKILIIEYWNAGFFVKINVFVSIWIVLYTIFYYIKLIIIQIEINKNSAIN